MNLTLGSVLRTMRQSRQETLRDVAGAVGISAVHLCDIERDRRAPSAAVLELMTEHFGCNADYLFFVAGKLPPDLEGPTYRAQPPANIEAAFASLRQVLAVYTSTPRPTSGQAEGEEEE